MSKDSPNLRKISLRKIFAIANGKERCILIIAISLSILNGAAMPLLMYVWGDSTDSFRSTKPKDILYEEVTDSAIGLVLLGLITFIMYLI